MISNAVARRRKSRLAAEEEGSDGASRRRSAGWVNLQLNRNRKKKQKNTLLGCVQTPERLF